MTQRNHAFETLRLGAQALPQASDYAGVWQSSIAPGGIGEQTVGLQRLFEQHAPAADDVTSLRLNNRRLIDDSHVFEHLARLLGDAAGMQLNNLDGRGSGFHSRPGCFPEELLGPRDQPEATGQRWHRPRLRSLLIVAGQLVPHRAASIGWLGSLSNLGAESTRTGSASGEP